ncbi:MAG TPA: hypothetical protein VKZ86_06695 [Cyclobacteriaceae bacterium]|nr:hypothetical protein [Cyclobacteriaceae bacterium]
MKQYLMMGAAVLAMAACQTPGGKKPVTTSGADITNDTTEMIQRGAYLVTIGACHDCHSPKVMTPEGPAVDTARLLSGHPSAQPVPDIPKDAQQWVLFDMGLTAFVGPWGVSFSANLTPDDTGIGNWSFEQFETAIRRGKAKGLETNRALLPPMPWEMYRHLTDEDLRSIFVYLKSIKPIDNPVPAPIPPNRLQASR